MKKAFILLLVLTMIVSFVTACSTSNTTDDPSDASNIPGEDTTKDSESVLTVSNCPDLEAVLFSKEASGKDFTTKYDGCYVEFEACIFKNEKSSITLDRSITVTGEFNTEGEASGWVIKIGDRTWGANIDESVETGDMVVIKGRVDAEWTDYYNCLYIEANSLTKKS